MLTRSAKNPTPQQGTRQFARTAVNLWANCVSFLKTYLAHKKPLITGLIGERHQGFTHFERTVVCNHLIVKVLMALGG